MTSKERMMRALRREKPDRLPVTIHQWQAYHLREYMGGCDQLEAFIRSGLDASIMPWPVMIDRLSPAQIRAETHALFRDFGKDGGYICSACDHFFETPPENLKHFAAAAKECTY